MLVYNQWDNTCAEVSPQLSREEPTRRAKPKRTEKKGWETNCAKSPVEQTNQIGQQPMGEERPSAVRQHATKTIWDLRSAQGMSDTCSRQACPPHSPEETYKRWVSTQHDSIQFCNGCSARYTRPQNLI